MYYVPSPPLAYDSVRFIMSELPLGWLLRGLHYWGASFLVVASVVHMLRVFFFGSYKAPRELTWLSGLMMLLVILGFSPERLPFAVGSEGVLGDDRHDQHRAQHAARRRGDCQHHARRCRSRRADARALVFGACLPAAGGRWSTLIAAHIALMRKHGISGPLEPHAGPSVLFFPWHVMKDTVMMAAVFASLITVAALFPAPLDEIANPADASYIPRPEWYFLSLFQLLKYFPGPLEPVATMVIPGLAIGFLALLPFIDRADGRHPFRSPRRLFTTGMAALGIGVIALTGLGVADRPPHKDRNDWGLLPIAGMQIATGEGTTCIRCAVYERAKATVTRRWQRTSTTPSASCAIGFPARAARSARP